MRLFVRPNEQFFNADDGPMTDRIDFSLSDGFNVLATRKIMSPLVCGSNYDCEFMARTREGPQYLVRKTQSCKVFFKNIHALLQQELSLERAC